MYSLLRIKSNFNCNIKKSLKIFKSNTHLFECLEIQITIIIINVLYFFNTYESENEMQKIEISFLQLIYLKINIMSLKISNLL